MNKTCLSFSLSFILLFVQVHFPILHAEEIAPTVSTTSDPYAGTEAGIQASTEEVSDEDIIGEIPKFHQSSLNYLTVAAEYVMLVAISGVAGLLFSACPKAIAVPSVAIFTLASITWLMREVYCVVRYKELTEEAKESFQISRSKDLQTQLTSIEVMRDNVEELRKLFKQKMITAGIWSAGFAAAFGAVIIENAAYQLGKYKYAASYAAFKLSTTALKAASVPIATAGDLEASALMAETSVQGDGLDLRVGLPDTHVVADSFTKEGEKELDECDEKAQGGAYLATVERNVATVATISRPETKLEATAAMKAHLASTKELAGLHTWLVRTKQWTVMRCMSYCASQLVDNCNTSPDKIASNPLNNEENFSSILKTLQNIILEKAHATPPQEWTKIFTLFSGATGLLYFVKSYRDAAAKVWKKPWTRMIAFGFFAANAALMAIMIKKTHDDLEQRVEDYDKYLELIKTEMAKLNTNSGSTRAVEGYNDSSRFNQQQYTGQGEVKPVRAGEYVGNEGATGCLKTSNDKKNPIGESDPKCECLKANNCQETTKIKIPEQKEAPYFQSPELQTLTNAMADMGSAYARGDGEAAAAIASSSEVRKAAATIQKHISNTKKDKKEDKPEKGHEGTDLDKLMSDFKDEEVPKFLAHPEYLKEAMENGHFSTDGIEFPDNNTDEETEQNIDPLEIEDIKEDESDEKKEAEVGFDEGVLDVGDFPEYIEPKITDEMRRKAAENFDFHDINPKSKPIFDIISRKYQMVFFYRRKQVEGAEAKEEKKVGNEGEEIEGDEREESKEKLDELNSFLIE